MTNSYDVDHGLSQCPPGPLEPVEIAQQDDTLSRTGNTARDQEMYAAGIRTGEENTKHNAAIRAGAGWLPIESAPKDGTPVLLFARLAGVNFATNSPYAPTIHVGAYRTDLCIWTGSAYRDQRGIEIEPTHWMPRPAFPDCAAPGVSTVEDASFPAGAIVNGRTLADRLEAYPFQSDGGDLRLCADWVEFRRCFEYLAEWVGRPAPAAGDALDALRELVECDSLKKRIASMQVCILETDDDVQELDAMMSDLARRQPAAWDAARAALAAQRKGDA